MSHASPSPSKKPRRVWRLNLRALAVLAAVGILLAGGLAALALVRSGDRSALEQARKLDEQGRPDLALSYLNTFLEKAAPSGAGRLEAVSLKARILSRRGDLPALQEAVKLGEQALRLAGDGPEARDLRREQLRRIAALAPYLPDQANQAVDTRRGLYRIGGAIAAALTGLDDDDLKALAARGAGDGAPGGAGARDAEALRLQARMLEGQSAGLGGDAGRLDEALALYELALAEDPADVEASTLLAWLYLERKGDADRGLAVLRGLLGRAPDSVPARMAMFRYRVEQARRAESEGRPGEAAGFAEAAGEAMAALLKVAPEDLDARLAAAEFELSRNRPEAARKLLEALPKGRREDPRARALLGLSSLKQNRVEEAIALWRQGLVAANGTDADLTWRLAYTLLGLGRLEEAGPLVEQYRRLTGSEEPTPRSRVLEALALLKANRPAEARAILEELRLKGGEELRPQVCTMLGQCCEAMRDEPAALERYAEALDADPTLPGPRLARIRLLRDRPEQAEEELLQALRVRGENPDLLVELARLELARQAARPADRRDLSALAGLVKRIEAVAPSSTGLLLLQADLLAFDDKQDEALKLLERASTLVKSDARIWVARAEALRRAGELDRAVLVLEQAMAPENAGDQAALRIAHARYLTLGGHGQEAREGLVRDLDRLPPDQRPEVWRALGDLYLAQRDVGEARRAFTQWAEMLPEDPLPHFFLLQQALAEGDRAAADAQIEALKKVSGERGLYWRVARVEELLRPVPGESERDREARFTQAGLLIEEIRVERPEERYAYLLNGQLLEAQGKKEQAARAYEQALERDGGAVALGRLAALYEALGDQAGLDRLRSKYADQMPTFDRALAESALLKGEKDEAERLAAKAAEERPEDFEVRLWQARLLARLGKLDAAEAALRKAVDREPERLEPRLALVALRVQRGDRAGASEVVEQIRSEVKGLDRPELTYAQCWRIVGDRERADEAMEAALGKWPEDPRVLRVAAEYDEATGRPERAEALLESYLESHPGERWAARALALLLSAHAGNRADWQKARAMVEGADDDQARLPEERLARGLVMARGPDPKDVEAAIEILSGLVLDLPADYPSSAVAREVLARVYLQRGQPEKAAPVAAVDAGSATATPQAVLRYAEILLAAKQAGRALEQLGRLGGDDLAVEMLRARALEADGRREEAAEVVRRSWEGHKGGEKARDEARGILTNAAAIDPALGVEIARKVAETWPADLWLEASALAREGADHADEALALFGDAVTKADPKDLPSLAQNALALVTGGGQADPARLARAEEVVRVASERAPESSALLTMLGYIRHFQGRYEDEVALYRQAIEENPENAEYLNNLAWALSEGLGKPEEALPYIERAFRAASKGQGADVPPQFFDTRGVIETRLGRLDRAIADLEYAVARRPTAGVVLAHLARAYHKAGKLDEFRRTARRALDAKLAPEQLEASERKELEPLIFGAGETASK